MKDVVPSAETLKAATRWERHAAWQEGFWLGFVFTTEPPQAHMLQARVEAALATLGRSQRVLRPGTPKQLEAVLPEIMAAAEWGCTWVEAVRGVDAESGAWTQAWIRLLLRANERRELLRGQLAGGLVFVADPAIKADIRAAAPDLWSVRTLVADLPAGPGSSEPVAVSAASDAGTRERVDLDLLDEDLRRATELDHQPLELQARGFFRLAGRLYAAGRHEEALAAIQRAVEHYRELSKVHALPSRGLGVEPFLPELAKVLHSLGASLRAVGRHREALFAVQEAVGIWRSLASATPDTFDVDLAMSLANLGAALSELGQREEALAATQEAVRLCREVVSARPDAVAELASVLADFGTHLNALGRSEEALEATLEALRYHAELASRSPDKFTPELARNLVNYGMVLWSLGRLDEARAATLEGVEHYRRLASVNPSAFLPEVARFLGGLGSIERERGDLPASLSAFSEALRMLEPYARSLPAAHDHRFQLLINGLEATCKEGGLTPPSDLQPLLDEFRRPSS